MAGKRLNAQESKQRESIVDFILEGSPGDAPAALGSQRHGSLALARLPVANDVRLVEDDAKKLHGEYGAFFYLFIVVVRGGSEEDLGLRWRGLALLFRRLVRLFVLDLRLRSLPLLLLWVPELLTDDLISRYNDIVLLQLPLVADPARTVIGMDLERTVPAEVALALQLPIRDDGQRADDERRKMPFRRFLMLGRIPGSSGNDTDNLKRLPQTHFVGENAPSPALRSLVPCLSRRFVIPDLLPFLILLLLPA
mmetsp:Transcript_9115/g.16693  ORF Transcript_9115/g.16693 Transcript_9115/m.16693 type:complete len:252 (+) Transcript_9115:557-1312(+)